MRRAPMLALALVAALAGAAPASAEDPPAPTITLLGPASGTAVRADDKFPPLFAWSIDFHGAQTSPVVVFELSSDPTFAGAKYSESRVCPPENPGCFTTLTAGTNWAYTATGGASWSAKAELTLYWRVKVTYSLTREPAVSEARTLKLAAAPQVQPDTEAPRLSVKAATAKRGTRAKVRFHAADNSGDLTLTIRLLYKGLLLGSSDYTGKNLNWLDEYYFAFAVPRTMVPGRYSVCFRASDAAGNSTERCARLTIR